MAILMNMCMIQNEKKEVLLQRRVKSWQGLAFPGGHVELNESLHASVKREILEETGLSIKKVKFCGIKHYQWENEKYIVFCYKTDDYSGNLLMQSDEGENVWMKVSDLTNDNVANGFLDMLPIFLGDYTELFYEETGQVILY